MNTTADVAVTRADGEFAERISQEALTDKVVHIVISLSEVVENLETIAGNIDASDLPSELRDRLCSYCRSNIERVDLARFSGVGGHDIRVLAREILDSLQTAQGANTLSASYEALQQWEDRVEDVRRLSRDLANRIFYRKKQKDKERIETAAMSHPLVKSWEGLSERDAVVRISRLRMNKFFNRQANDLEILMRRGSIQTRPSRITLEPTSACNYRCTMCPQGHYTERPSYFEVDDETVERGLPVLEFTENLATQVTGEPTLSLQLGKIANYASSHGVYIDMITNGSLLQKTNADLGRFSVICISFDGATKEVFEAQRVGASFENVVKNIRHTRGNNPLVEFEFNVCVTRLNIGQLADIVRLAVELDVDRVRFNPLNTRDYPHLAALALGANNVEELDAAIDAARAAAASTTVRVFNYITDRTLTTQGAENPTPVPQILSDLAALETKNSSLSPLKTAERLLATEFPLMPGHLDLHWKDWIPDTNDGRGSPGLVDRQTVAEKYDALFRRAKKGLGSELRLPYCTAPYKGGIIFANGDYTPCCYMTREALYGSLSRTSFERIWNSGGLQEFRRSMFDDGALIPTCRDCNGRQRYTFTTELLRVAHRLGYRWEDIEFPANFNPPAAVKAQINALRGELFTQEGPAYELGTMLRFGEAGNSRPFASMGFSAPSANAVWNEGFESVVTLRLDGPVKGDLRLDVKLLPFLHGDLLPRQTVAVHANGDPVADWCLDRPVPTDCQATISASRVADDGRLELAFRFPNATSWYHLGVNRSKATRSVMFAELCLSAALP